MVQKPGDKVYRFDQSLVVRAERLRKEARGTPAGVKRDELLRRAVQIENEVQTKSRTDDQQGLKPPV